LNYSTFTCSIYSPKKPMPSQSLASLGGGDWWWRERERREQAMGDIFDNDDNLASIHRFHSFSLSMSEYIGSGWTRKLTTYNIITNYRRPFLYCRWKWRCDCMMMMMMMMMIIVIIFRFMPLLLYKLSPMWKSTRTTSLSLPPPPALLANIHNAAHRIFPFFLARPSIFSWHGEHMHMLIFWTRLAYMCQKVW